MEFKKPRLYILEGNDIEWIYVRPISENRFATPFNLSMAIGPGPGARLSNKALRGRMPGIGSG